MKKLAAIVALTVLFVAPLGAEAQDTQWNRYTLENLDGVHVRFEVAETCQSLGVTATDYEADTSVALIEAEVGVLTREEMLAHLALPELLVTIECGDAGGGATPYLVGLRVQQAAQMLRDTQITMPEAVTWFTHRIGTVTSQSASSVIGETLEASVSHFAEAWAAANSADGSR